jgi:hypothetical protein
MGPVDTKTRIATSRRAPKRTGVSFVLRSRGEMRGDIGPRQLLEHSSQNAIGIWNTVNGTAGISFLLSIFLPCSQSCRFWPPHEFPSVPWGWNSCFFPTF